MSTVIVKETDHPQIKQLPVDIDFHIYIFSFYYGSQLQATV